ncbi:MAG: Protein of unknown function precursor [Chthoniobacteraceae bacterium]|nr:Protein of unknown function precursor [Chthoniobacteraceae bacterium]
MKLPLPLLILACHLTWSLTTSEAALVAGWDFQGTTAAVPIGTAISMPPNTPRDFTANAGVFQATSHLFFDGTNGSSSFFVGTANDNSELGALNGITANTDGTTFSQAVNTPAGAGSVALFNRGSIDGKSAVFRLAMTGYQDLQFSFAVQRPASAAGDYGVSLFSFSYSTDGNTFLPWGSIDTGKGISISNTAFSMPTTLSAVNDAPTVFLKMTVSDSTGGKNSTRIDNIQLNAAAIPEPSVVCSVLLGAGMLACRRGSRR